MANEGFHRAILRCDVQGLFEHGALPKRSGRLRRQPTTIGVPAKAGTHFSARELPGSGHHRRSDLEWSKTRGSMGPGFRESRDAEKTFGVSDGGAGDRTEGAPGRGFPG